MTSQQPPKRAAQNQFSKLASAYRHSKTHAQTNALASAANSLSNRRYACALDIGAGPGFTAFAIASQCDRVIASDITPEMLEQARSLRHELGAPQTELILADAENLPFPSNAIDLVTCRTAAHHFLNINAWLAEVHRILSPNGELILIDTVSPDDPQAAAWMRHIEVWRDPSHARNLRPDEWTEAASRAGLRVQSARLSRVHLEYPDWTQRAGMEETEAARLGDALRNAPPSAVAAFGVSPKPQGVIEFHWPVVTMKAVKPATTGAPL